MSKKEDQIKMIEELYASGSISEAEYNEMLGVVEKEHGKEPPINTPPKNKKRVKPLVVLGLVIPLLLIAVWAYLNFYERKNNSSESLNLVNKRCECESLLNNAEKLELNELKNRISNSEFQFQDEVDALVQKINDKRIESTFSQNTRKCQGELDALNHELTVKYPIGTKEGDLFWAKAEKEYAAQSDYAAQEEMDVLKESINTAKQSIFFTSKQNFAEAKARTSSFLQAFFSSYGQDGFDAYTWFSDEIEQYILAKNKTPDYINQLFNGPNIERVNNQFHWVPETLSYVRNDGAMTVWLCKVEFRCYRPTMLKYQNSLITYEVKIDENQKIKALSQFNVENTTFED